MANIEFLDFEDEFYVDESENVSADYSGCYHSEEYDSHLEKYTDYQKVGMDFQPFTFDGEVPFDDGIARKYAESYDNSEEQKFFEKLSRTDDIEESDLNISTFYKMVKFLERCYTRRGLCVSVSISISKPDKEINKFHRKSPEDKRLIKHLLAEGYTISEISRKTGFARDTVRKVKNQYN